MKRLIALGAIAVLGAAGAASAEPLDIPYDSPIYFQFNNIEQVDLGNDLIVPGGYNGTNTQGNWGVFNLSSVQLGAALLVPPNTDIAGGPAFFSDDGPGGTEGQITGIFYDIQATSPTTATGGFIDLYWHEPGSDTITANCLAGVTCLPDASTVSAFTSGTFLVRLEFASGIDPSDPNVFIRSTTDPTTIGLSGFADSFANVDTSIVGAWTDVLNGDWFITDFGTRDLRFSNFYNNLLSWGTGANGTVGLRSNDPGRVFTAEAVPEPFALTLLGLGLMGLGARARRRKNEN